MKQRTGFGTRERALADLQIKPENDPHRRRLRLGPLILLIQVVLLLGIGGVVAAVGYVAARAQLTAAVALDFERARKVAGVVLEERLSLLSSAVSLLAQDQDLQRLAATARWQDAASVLYEASLPLSGLESGVVLLVDSGGIPRADVSGLVDDATALAAATRPYLHTRQWRLVGEDAATLVRAEPIILDTTGEVVAHLIHGLPLAGNPSLIHDLRRSTGSESLLLYAGGVLQGRAPKRTATEHTAKGINFAGATQDQVIEFSADHVGFLAPVRVSDTASVDIGFVVDTNAFAELTHAYRRTLWIFAGLVLAGGLAAMVTLRWLVILPARRMSVYARSLVTGGGETIPYHRSGIAEFDTMGQVVQSVFSDLQVTNRTLEAMVAARTRDLEESQTRTRLILETAADGILSLDAAGHIISANPAAGRIFGYDPKDLEGQDLSSLVPDLTIPTPLDEAGAASRIDAVPIEREGRHRNGAAIPIDATLTTMATGGPPTYTAFIRDIRQRKADQRALIDARRHAEDANAAKSLFLANMSHEIRTPMNAILGFLDLALRSPDLPEPAAEYLRTAHDSAGHLLEIINDILDISKLESGKLALEDRCFNLPQVVRETVALLDQRAIEKGLTLDFRFDSTLSHCFTGDDGRLRQVLINLIGNAVKFTETGSITVRVRPGDQIGMLRFEIEDTGIGIPADKIDRIFDSFTQVDSGMSRPFGGTGLGTSICRQLVTLMGGRIWVESVLGQGSTFFVTLPLGKPTCVDACPHNARTDETPRLLSYRKFRVLLAEDMPQNAELVCINLNEQGHAVSVVGNGAAALEALAKGEHDIVLMDVQMPIMDGLEATRSLRAAEPAGTPGLPIIGLTASVLNEGRDACIDAGMDTVVTKPINFAELFATMEAVVPEGRGHIDPEVTVSLRSEPVHDLDDLTPVADVAAGLTLWRHADAYRRALTRFAIERANDAERIGDALTVGDVHRARQICHALRGITGNLALTQLATAVGDLAKALRSGPETTYGHRLQGVADELERAVGMILHFRDTASRPRDPSISVLDIVQRGQTADPS